jgi:hypothetical protein
MGTNGIGDAAALAPDPVLLVRPSVRTVVSGASHRS